jgi:hypothetical protein
MTPRRQLSEREKLGCVAVLFPPLWPLAIAMFIGWAVEDIVAAIRRRRK